ncbi:MAG: Ig-like domain-containing protein [Acidimicrobiia bacterium]
MKRRLIPLALLVGSVASVALTTVVLAAWTATTATGGVSGARAATLPVGNTPTATNAGGASVTVAWTATTLPDGTGVAAYVVRAYNATSGAARAIGADCDAVVATTCTETSAPDGSWQYSVEPHQGLWGGAESAKSNTVVVDTTAPTVAITFPVAGGAYSSAGWSSGCAGQICGTAADAGTGVESVAVSIRAPNGNYWNGTAFASNTEVLLRARGTTSWARSFRATNFASDGIYTVRAVATDNVGLTADATTTFTLDTVQPTVAIAFPGSDGAYDDAGWTAGCFDQICGTAADTGSGLASVSLSIRNAIGNYWDGAAFASNTEVLVPATGTTNWALAFPAANFPADGDYTVRAVATDNAGLTAEATTAFTIDNTQPTVEIAFPEESGIYDTAAWDAGCSSRICGTAADTGSGVASMAVSIRDDNSGNYWDGTAFNSSTEILLPGDGTTDWSFAFAAKDFPADGDYTVRAVATDRAGNTAEASATFTITNE